MKVPISWMKEYVEFDLSAEQVATKLTMGGLEVEGIENSSIGPVLDVYVTPNRGDCLSVVGVAREVSALLGSPLQYPAIMASIKGGDVQTLTSVTIDAPDLCPRYAARIVEGVRVGPSPAWLQERLEAAGQRSVNNVVDATNYIMLELGQPMHAFDLDRLTERRVIIRKANPGEKITTLDGEQRKLTPEMLVIADGQNPVAIAGVMGGADSEVTEKTTRILLESAHFAPLSVRRTSLTLGLRSEASYRFERVVDPDGVVRALDRCVDILHKVGLTKAIGGVIDVYPQPKPITQLSLRASRTSELLGMEIDAETCTHCLQLLGFDASISSDNDRLIVTAPSNRADVTIEEDLIEEVGRIYGYENIPETLPTGITTRGGESELGRATKIIKQVLAACGMREVITHSLTGPSFLDGPDDDQRKVSVRNALSASVAGLRRSLLPTLVDVAQSNSARGQHNLAIFEVGRVWQNEPSETGDSCTAVEYVSVAGLMVGTPIPGGWRGGGKSSAADYSAIKGVLDRLLDRLKISGFTLRAVSDRSEPLPQLHPGRSATISFGGGRPDGVIGELHPSIAAHLDLRSRIYVFEISLDALRNAAPTTGLRYRPISRQQAVQRDIAPRVAENVSFAAIVAAISAANTKILSEYRLTDVYRGAPLPKNVKSLTVSLTFAYQPTSPADDRAVTDSEINDALVSIRSELTARCGADFVG